MSIPLRKPFSKDRKLAARIKFQETQPSPQDILYYTKIPNFWLWLVDSLLLNLSRCHAKPYFTMRAYS